MKKSYKNKLPKELEVVFAGVRVENGELIVDVEFKKKFEPKDGDFLAVNNDVFIYNGKQTEESYGAYVGTLRSGKIDKALTDDSWTDKASCRYATESEKKAFLERLEKECGKRWNPEKKCLEDIINPEDGDFLVSDSCSIFICSGIKGNYIGCHCALLCGGILTPVATNFVVREANIRFATEEEKKQIIDSLKKEGKRWNPETKQIEDVRWRAEKGEYFYHIEFADKSIKVFQSSDNRGNHSSNLYARNNYFRTPEAAEKVADQIKEIFKNSKAE